MDFIHVSRESDVALLLGEVLVFVQATLVNITDTDVG